METIFDKPLNKSVTANETSIGILSNLTTTDKTSVVAAINEVNDSLGTLGTPVSVTVNKGTGITTDTMSCYKMGRLCVFNARFKSSSQVTGSNILFSGLPTCIYPYKTTVQKLNGVNAPVALYGSNLQNDWGAIEANTDYFIYMVYFTQS